MVEFVTDVMVYLIMADFSLHVNAVVTSLAYRDPSLPSSDDFSPSQVAP